jgi:3-oxoadipate enol-lactonase
VTNLTLEVSSYWPSNEEQKEGTSMLAKISRRDLIHAGCIMAGAAGVSTFADSINTPARSNFAGTTRGEEIAAPTGAVNASVELFYRDDWLGAPWVTPDPVMFIHGNDESSVSWFGWVPRMGQEFRLLRPDLPGLGRSAIPPGFEWSISSLAKILAHFLDSVGVQSAHIIGAKSGGSIAMQFAADYPQRTRTLVVASAPITPVSDKVAFHAPSSTSQRKRLGSAASKEQIEYWDKMMSSTSTETRAGIGKVEAAIDMEPVLPHIVAPTLVITVDQSGLQSVEKVIQYQQKIPNSRLLVLPSDGYHVAVVKADECVTNVLSFIKETQRH